MGSVESKIGICSIKDIGITHKEMIKGCLCGWIGILSIVVIIFTARTLLLNNLFPFPPNKNEIRGAVIKNEIIFDDAVIDIKKLDKYIDAIKHTKYRTAEKNPTIKGLFTGGLLNGQHIQTPLENKTLEKLFLDVGVEDIFIYNNCIDFSFGGTGRDYNCGVLWTSDGKPIGSQGEKMDFVKEGVGWGWKEDKGDNRYYTEQIFDNWYFYEAWF